MCVCEAIDAPSMLMLIHRDVVLVNQEVLNNLVILHLISTGKIPPFKIRVKIPEK